MELSRGGLKLPRREREWTVGGKVSDVKERGEGRQREGEREGGELTENKLSFDGDTELSGSPFATHRGS